MDRRTGMPARHRGRRQSGEGRRPVRERPVRHRTVSTGRILRAVTAVIRRVQWLFFDAGRLGARAVAVATTVAALVITRPAVDGLRHVGERGAWITRRSHVFHGSVVRPQHVQQAVVEVAVVDQVLQI